MSEKPKMRCQRCKRFTEHKHTPATASDPVNRFECLGCGFASGSPLNPWAKARLKREAGE